MKSGFFLPFAVLLVCGLSSAVANSAGANQYPPSVPPTAAVESIVGAKPTVLVKNLGQLDDRLHFPVHGLCSSVYFT
jgi:hypothetical protein